MSETKHSTLLPCPFCGDTDPSMAETGVFWLRCTSCTAEGAPFDTEAEAIAAWNTRAATSLHHELVAALETLQQRAGVVATWLNHWSVPFASEDEWYGPTGDGQLFFNALNEAAAVLAKAKPNLDEPRG